LGNHEKKKNMMPARNKSSRIDRPSASFVMVSHQITGDARTIKMPRSILHNADGPNAMANMTQLVKISSRMKMKVHTSEAPVALYRPFGRAEQ
jgi:hypothetical protein